MLSSVIIMVLENHFEISDVTDKGATILCGGHAIDSKGYFIKSTVLINVDYRMQVIKEEYFGR